MSLLKELTWKAVIQGSTHPQIFCTKTNDLAYMQTDQMRNINLSTMVPKVRDGRMLYLKIHSKAKIQFYHGGRDNSLSVLANVALHSYRMTQIGQELWSLSSSCFHNQLKHQFCILLYSTICGENIDIKTLLVLPKSSSRRKTSNTWRTSSKEIICIGPNSHGP